jgi:hypothetical protein
MAKRKQQTDTQKAGYRNPPKHSQFKKGQSGNPAGRPLGSGSLAAAIRRQGEMIAPVKLDGKPATYYDLIGRRLCHEAATGDLKAAAEILKVDKEPPATELSGDWVIMNGYLVPVVNGVPEMEVKLILEEDEPQVSANHLEFARKFPNYDPDRPMEEWGPHSSDSVP